MLEAVQNLQRHRHFRHLQTGAVLEILISHFFFSLNQKTQYFLLFFTDQTYRKLQDSDFLSDF